MFFAQVGFVEKKKKEKSTYSANSLNTLRLFIHISKFLSL